LAKIGFPRGIITTPRYLSASMQQNFKSLFNQPNGSPNSKICVVLPYPPVYSETFLKMHVEKLHAAVRYLEHFPVHLNHSYFNPVSASRNELLQQRFKGILHRYVLNPAKKIYLQRFFKRSNVGVVLAEYGGTGVGVLGFCQQQRIPMVVHFHGSDAYHRENLDRYRESYKRMFAYSSAIIAVSKHMMKQLAHLGAPHEKLFYNPYGTDVSMFKQASPRLAPLQVIAVGRFVETKAPYLTILAFNKVLERLPDAKLVMLGTGSLFDVCHQLVRSLRIEHAVDFKGQASHDEVASLMQQSRVFVQHSLVPASGDSEGTPVAIIEAGASGLPVISTKHAGIMDVVIDGRTGFLVEEGDISAMADRLFQLLSDSELAAEMGGRAREHIVQNFNSKNSVQNLRDLLDRYCT
jgi:glycosyltransferase involved in cell wall biosynthesis